MSSTEDELALSSDDDVETHIEVHTDAATGELTLNKMLPPYQCVGALGLTYRTTDMALLDCHGSIVKSVLPAPVANADEVLVTRCGFMCKTQGKWGLLDTRHSSTLLPLPHLPADYRLSVDLVDTDIVLCKEGTCISWYSRHESKLLKEISFPCSDGGHYIAVLRNQDCVVLITNVGHVVLLPVIPDRVAPAHWMEVATTYRLPPGHIYRVLAPRITNAPIHVLHVDAADLVTRVYKITTDTCVSYIVPLSGIVDIHMCEYTRCLFYYNITKRAWTAHPTVSPYNSIPVCHTASE